MWRNASLIALVVSSLAGLIAAISQVKKMPRTVPPECIGLMFWLNRAIVIDAQRAQVDFLGALKWVEPGIAMWRQIPGLHCLRFVQVKRNLTADTTITIQDDKGRAHFIKPVLDFTLTRQAAYEALCRAPGSFDALVTMYFQDAVNTAMAAMPRQATLPMVRAEIERQLAGSVGFGNLGVEAVGILLTELSPTPSTQIADAMEDMTAAMQDLAQAVRSLTAAPHRSDALVAVTAATAAAQGAAATVMAARPAV